MRRGLIFGVVLLAFLFPIAVSSRASNQAPVGWMTTDPEVANETYRPIVETWVGFPIAFNASDSSDADGTIVKYEWDWEDDGSYDYAETPGDGIATHTYPQAGAYRVRLKVTDDDDATADAEY